MDFTAASARFTDSSFSIFYLIRILLRLVHFVSSLPFSPTCLPSFRFCICASYRVTSTLFAIVFDDRSYIIACKFFSAFQSGKFHKENNLDYFAAKFLYQFRSQLRLVPPVAIRSSTIATFCPGLMESLCISIVGTAIFQIIALQRQFRTEVCPSYGSVQKACEDYKQLARQR